MKRLLIFTAALLALLFLSVGCSKSESASESAKETVKEAGNAISEAAKKASEETKVAAKKMGEFASDASITAKIKMKFASDEKVSVMNISVDTKDGMVTLQGEVSSKEERERAIELAKSVEGVKMVHSNLKMKKK